MTFFGWERAGRQMAVLLSLSAAAALLSNAAAGPTRRLAWRPALAPAPTVRRPEAAPRPATPTPPSPPTNPSPRPSPRTQGPEGGNAKPAPTLQSLYPPPADGAPLEIDGAQALALHRLGARFVDARRTAAFEAGHIAGARSVPLWEDGVEARLQALDAETKDPNDPVVIYCTGGSCRDSHDLAQRLWLLGFRNLRIYAGGWPEWEAQGWPASRGPEARR